MTQTQFSISSNTIFRLVTTGLALWFLYLVRDVIALLLIAIIITASLNPIINYFQRWRVPRGVVVALVYVLFFTLVSWLVSVIVPTLAQQIMEFSANMQKIFAQFSNSTLGILFGMQQFADSNAVTHVSQNLSGSVGEIFSRTASLFTSLVATMAVISMSFYMSLQKNGMQAVLISITPQQHQKYVMSLVQRIQESFGRWMAGQVVTMIFVGVMYYIVLALLGVPYAALIALFGGLLEIIPYMGPTLAVIPAALLGFAISPMTGMTILATYGAINLVENHLLVPQIMNKAVGLNPVVVILALLVGAKIAGLVGVILAVPLAGAVAVFAKDVLEKKVV